jgi:restriction endonuclease S subunit
LIALEEKVLAKKPYKLRHYSLKMASGATPTIVEVSKYYADKESGVPFIRVQNLDETGLLSLDDLKYITHETHENYLKRSQVQEDDLLVKITGVGRMAVAGVPPKGFEGNINQHVVAIKTENRETSEVLAAYLNSDIGEKLASRRSTGGTRPALDYPAVKSIPIIYEPRLIELATNARERKYQKEKQANDLLESINTFLLKELGITLPELPSQSINNRIYLSKRKAVSGNRFDPFYSQDYFNQVNEAVKNGKLKWAYLKEVTKNGFIKGYLPNADEKEGRNKVVQINSINADGSINLGDVLTAKDVYTNHEKLLIDDILIVITGATIGKVGYWQYTGDYYLGGDIIKFQTAFQIDPYYVFAYLRSQPAQIELKRNVTGATNGHLSPHDVGHIIIPIPTDKKEYGLINDLSKQVKATRVNAFKLLREAEEEFTEAKKEIENLILG